MAPGVREPSVDSGRRAASSGLQLIRRGLAAVGVLLVLVVAGFLIAGKLRARNWVKGLPGRLGVGITQDANGYTYDQSLKGRKIFTVHAAKELQRSDGKVVLHDVGIVTYGATGQPTDRIHGNEFTYDAKAQLLIATGEVFIDLLPPAAKDDSSMTPDLTSEETERKMVHVKSIGLVFDQKGQLASSDGPVEFRTEGYTGNAVGASYDSKNNLILLKSSVRMSGIRDGRPMLLTASYAAMDRRANLITLEAAHYVSAASTGAETASARHAFIHTNAAGSPEKINAEGSVTLTSDQRGTVTSDKLDLNLGDHGQAQAEHLYGDVQYRNDTGAKRQNGHAEDARIAFDPMGRPVRALMSGAVTYLEQGPGERRELASATFDVSFGGGGKEPSFVRSAQAFGQGGAMLKQASEDVRGRTATIIQADKLIGRFAPLASTTELTGLDGAGHSRLQRATDALNGAQVSKDTSTGDLLQVDFTSTDRGHSELSRAEQKGSVTTIHEASGTVNGRPATPTVERSRADDEVYVAASNKAFLTGNAEIEDETSALAADKVDINRDTGDESAEGAVKVTYLTASANPESGKLQEPVHVLADRATAHKASGLAEFFGSGSQLARMWQGTSQVEAPVLNFYRTEKRLVAHGGANGNAATVRAILAPPATPTAIDSGISQSHQNQATTHIAAREMIYTDSARTIELRGSVRVVDQDGTLQSSEATVWLTPAKPTSSPGKTSTSTSSSIPATEFIGGHVDHIVATGAVVIDQPGRRGTGNQLVYNAGDGVYTLTGSKADPPKVVDQAQGSVTGAALRFKSGDNSVEVLGSEDGKAAGRVRSETRIKR